MVTVRRSAFFTSAAWAAAPSSSALPAAVASAANRLKNEWLNMVEIPSCDGAERRRDAVGVNEVGQHGGELLFGNIAVELERAADLRGLLTAQCRLHALLPFLRLLHDHD